jgi:hypothetical protein
MLASQGYYGSSTLRWGQGYEVDYIDDFIDSGITKYQHSINYHGWDVAADTTFYTDEAKTPQTIIGSTGYSFNEPGPLGPSYPNDKPSKLYVI